jgi:hypothetical protein
MRGMREAIEEYKQAERMFNYAYYGEDIDCSIYLMEAANTKMKAYRNLDPKVFVTEEIKEEIDVIDKLKSVIKSKLKEGVAYVRITQKETK